MKNKVWNMIFCLLFMLIISVPAILINTKKMQISEIDNKTLTEWPGITWKLENRDKIEAYIDDRIGFREFAINTYIDLNDKLFTVMVHPLFMYGQDGHIFYKDKDYIAAYQHLNTDKQMLDDFTEFLSQTQAYLDSKDIRFLYFLCPDKKTIYSEYFPTSIHVNQERESVIDYLRSKLEKTDVNYIIPTDALFEAKKDQVIYNKKYDATHWNEFGAMTAHKLIDEEMQSWFDDVPKLTEDSYNLEFVKVDSLDIAKFPIEEEVPVYSLKDDHSTDATEYLSKFLQGETLTFYSHYTNPDAVNGEILLVFVDSYFGNYQKYYNNRFKEVYFVHRQNYDYLQNYVNLFFPDVVIFETAERSISSEMPLLADFKDYYYEPPYDPSAVMTNQKLDYSLITTIGAAVKDHKLVMKQDDATNIVRLDGILDTKYPKEMYQVYAHVGEVYLECNFCELERASKEAGRQYFSVNIQRRYMAEGKMELIAVNSETNEMFMIDEFEVVYED
ncbi:MAG: hypothetical protein GX567_00740 [Clostridia bacterium]|nr:hypothetical protein [Clostridia bacterium]